MRLTLPGFLILSFWCGGLALASCVPGKNVFATDYSCRELADPGLSEWKIMECPHPFVSKRAALKGTDCSMEAYRRGPPPGVSIPCGWTAGTRWCFWS